MSIIISSNGSNAKKIDKSNFDKEDYLQNYIHQNPESIPVYEIKEDKRLLVVAREFPTESGPIDALAVDTDGDIYIVETKLYKNPDKRTVVAQALDYGASMWKHLNDFSEFLQRIEKAVQTNFNVSFLEKAKSFFNIDDEAFEILKEAMRRNLDDGNLKFVILMDSMDERLKDLIIYVNQNSQFDIYAVQLEYYKFEKYEIMIPKIFGVEVKKNINSGSAQSRNSRGETETIEYFKQNLNQDELKIFLRIHDFCKSDGAKINYGTGRYASFSPIFKNIDNNSLFTVSADKERRLAINFEWVNNDTAQKMYKELFKIGFSFPENYLDIRPSILFTDWKDKIDGIIQVVKELNNVV